MKRVSAPLISLITHAAVGLAVARGNVRPKPPPPQVRIEVAVVEKAAPTPPARATAPEPPKPLVHPVRSSKAALSSHPSPVAPVGAPPPPSAEAVHPSEEAPVAIAGISFESTSSAGSFAVATGNTLSAAPDRVARNPRAAKPYRADRYATAAQLAEAPSVLNREGVDIRRYYPKDALQRGVEGEVVLRLTIDADGSIAEAVVVKDPGEGLGSAALRAVREFRFAPGKVDGAAVATAIPFVIRFVLS